MQTQPLTWQAAILQLLQILGPAILILIGTAITLRHQRKLKRDELISSSTLRARELVFNHYQKKLDRLTAASDDLGNSLGGMQALLQSHEPGDPVAVATKFIGSLTSILLMAKHESEGVEDELKGFGLWQQYEKELGVLNKLKSGYEWHPQGSFDQQAEDIRNLLLSLVLIQEALLGARMKELFHEYLPARQLKTV